MGSRRVSSTTVVSRNGETLEDTFDWYAQDKDGNLWYLGEDTKRVRGRQGDDEGGLLGGRRRRRRARGHRPGEPKQGITYREEYYAGHAEDAAEVLGVNSQVQVPFGRFKSAMLRGTSRRSSRRSRR